MESDGASANVFGQRTRQLRDMKALPLARKDDMMSLHGGGRLGRISYGWRARLFTRCMWIFGDSAALCEKRRRNTAKSGGEINSNKRKKSNRGCGSTTNALCRWLDIEVRECFRSSLISSLGLLRKRYNLRENTSSSFRIFGATTTDTARSLTLITDTDTALVYGGP